jgi:hypothetical protein
MQGALSPISSSLSKKLPSHASKNIKNDLELGDLKLATHQE